MKPSEPLASEEVFGTGLKWRVDIGSVCSSVASYNSPHSCKY